MQTYQKMKDSGEAWLGEIPEVWPQKPMRHLFRLSKQVVGSRSEDYELLSLTMRGVIPRSEVSGGKNPENYETYQIAEPNNLLVCLFDYDVTPRTVGEVTRAGMVTGAYTILKPAKDVSTRFYYYLFLSLDYKKELLHLCTGLRNGLSKPVFFSLNVPAPDYDTQQKIAEFLDAETEKIDHLIVKQERLLELLEEKRRATITHAVTRGLDPNVELKETNITWLGKVPIHWTIQQLRHACFLQRGSDLSKDAFIDGPYPVMGSNGVIGNHYKMTTKGPSLTVGRSGSVGKVNLVEGDFWAHNTALFLKKGYGNNLKYLYYVLSSIDINLVSNGSAVPTLDRNNVHALMYGIPAVEEQEDIVIYLDEQESKVNKLKQKIQNQVMLLRERRTSLISHAVTGKIKV